MSDHKPLGMHHDSKGVEDHTQAHEKRKKKRPRADPKSVAQEVTENDDEDAADADWASLTKAQRRNKHKKQKLKEALLAKRGKGQAVSGQAETEAEVGEDSGKEDDDDNGKERQKKTAKKSKAIDREKKKEREKEKEEEKEEVYPYAVDDDDHCETPLEAYEDILPVLDGIAAALGKTRASLSLYDPYYCEGTMRKHLLTCGFPDVHNVKEDFYANIAKGACPVFDVLITNPPYSAEHVPRLLRYAVQSGKPFFLLMPNYFYMKDYYQACLTKVAAGTAAAAAAASASASAGRVSPFYIAPIRRYQYTTPKGRRQAKSGKYTAPFPSFWYCSLGGDARLASAVSTARLQAIYGAYSSSQEQSQKLSTGAASGDGSSGSSGSGGGGGGGRQVVFAPRLAALPLCVLPENDPRKKAERNDRKRVKHQERKLLKQQQQR